MTFDNFFGVCCPSELNTDIQTSIHAYPQRVDEAPSIWNDEDTGKRRAISDLTSVIRSVERGCGLSTNSFSQIFGGRLAGPYEWPWMAAVIRQGYLRIFCGGVLISDRHILSAAHCYFKINKNEITVRLGEYNFQEKNETRARDFRIVEVYQHPDFDETTFENDISILKLHERVIFNSYIWPVCMPSNEDTFEGNVGIVTGWGSQFFGGPHSDVLMEVSVPIWNQNDCQNAFIERIANQVLCAGAGERDSCQVSCLFVVIYVI